MFITQARSQIFKLTRLRVVDISAFRKGASLATKPVKCIHIYNKNESRHGGVGDKKPVTILGQMKKGYVVGFVAKQRTFVPYVVTCIFSGFLIYAWTKRDKSLEENGISEIIHNFKKRLYHMLPLRVTSSLWGKINSIDLPVWTRSRIYDLFCRTYNCDMSEALESDYSQYRNLGEFFKRRLKPDSRPISKEPGVVSPADGQIIHFGPIGDGRIEQVKGLDYSVQTFLGLPNDNYDDLLVNGKEKSDLYHCIIYLAPGDYHRFHSPAGWTVKFRRHFPGRLLSVRPSLMERMPEVLHINERVCYVGQWSHGFFSMTAVGATNVGSIKVNFDEDLRTNRRHLWRPDRCACLEHEFSQEVNLTAGEDFGEFNFGSTIVLIFEAPRNTTFDLKQNQKIKYGQLLSKIPSIVHSEPSNTV